MATAVQSEPLVTIPGGFYEEASHSYFNESKVVRPSVTQILDSVGLTDLSRVKPEILEHKRKLGDAVHYFCHLLARNPGKHWWEVMEDAPHPETEPYCMAFVDFWENAGFEIDVVEGKPQTEISGIHKSYGLEFGYTFDLRGKWQGFPVIADIKCTYDEEPSWKWQTAAYEMTQPRPEGSPTYGRLVIHLKPDQTYKLVPFKDPQDVRVFAWALGLTYEKIKHGLPWRKESGNGR